MRRSRPNDRRSRHGSVCASEFLPEVWAADEPIQALRRQITRRNHIVWQRSTLKNIIPSILHAHLAPSCPHADLCGAKGRVWRVEQVVQRTCDPQSRGICASSTGSKRT